MRRLSGILLLTGATLIVIVALLVSGLRFALPYLDRWRPQVLDRLTRLTGLPIDASQLQARWENVGPTLDARYLSVGLSDGGQLNIKRIALALDVWKSLLHARWTFHDLTFYQLQMRMNTPLNQNHDDEAIPSSRASDLFLRQFDHFDLRDSTISFLTPSGQRAELTIPQLTWVNGARRHRAEGHVSLSSLTGQHGVMQVRMDLRDDNGLLNNGTVWMQSDNVDVKPWLSQWMQQHVELNRAQFSMAAWVTLREGGITGGDILLKQGGASWQGDNTEHRLSVDNLTAHIAKVGDGWQLNIPDTSITLDDISWPKGALLLGWFPQRAVMGSDRLRSNELRVRASKIELSGLEALLPVARRFSPKLKAVWNAMQPAGMVDELALDIPLQAPEKTRIQGRWRDLSWKQWQLLPGIKHLSGTVSGSVEHGRLTAAVYDTAMPYAGVLSEPLAISQGKATLEWRNDQRGWQLDGSNIDVSATALRARGDFRYLQPVLGEPWLGILAGVSMSDAGQVWRYFPESLLDDDLIDYLKGAIKGGTVENATLVYGGNPHHFPYTQHDGQFQATVPLRQATFAFQPTWPVLKDFDINLDLINDGLWMHVPEVKLGGVKGYNLSAVIPEYNAKKLLIDADIAGPGRAVGLYFKDTPLKTSLGTTLDELQLTGDVSARLYLNIPLDGEMTTAKGDVTLRNNRLYVKPVNSTLENLSGNFHFVNGDLESGPIKATWFNQPLNIAFNTHDQDRQYNVGVKLDGNWQPTRTGLLPAMLNDSLRGSVPWQGAIDIILPAHAGAKYNVNILADLKNVSSHLPPPVDKTAGEPLPVNFAVKGDMRGFTLSGSAGPKNHFNSRWLLGTTIALDKGRWTSDSHAIPPLPDVQGAELNLPAVDGAQWLALFTQNRASGTGGGVTLPERIMLRTPSLTFGDQRWNQLRVISTPQPNGIQHIDIQGREINAALTRQQRRAWQINVPYLYFNPSSDALAAKDVDESETQRSHAPQISLEGLPDVQLRCAECWLYGQKFGRIEGDFSIKGDTLQLANGLLDTGFARLTANGEWINNPHSPRTSLKGKLHGGKLEEAAGFFGFAVPLKAAPFDLDYDLHWRAVPWLPDMASLSGILHARLGKGEIMDASTGHTGQLLRFLSVDTLMRKLRLDFSDAFGDGFYFDSIRSTAWVKDGILHTDDTLIDGLEADIAMKGRVALVSRELDMEAIVAPEISATVGVATAFAVNPIIGAAVFAASRVLGPLWNKVSILRYHITGPVATPQINEVLRTPLSAKTQ